MLSKSLHLLVAIGTMVFCTLHSTAQYYGTYSPPDQSTAGSNSFNFIFGSTAFLGDLGGTKGKGQPFIKDFNSKTMRPVFGVSYSYFPHSWISLNAGVNLTWVNGADSLIVTKTGNAFGRWERNLSFRSDIAEVNAGIELYPFQTLWQYEEARWRPYIGAGAGLFYFNPKAKLDGNWYALKPLHLEGQGFAEYPERKNYKLTQLYIPVTFGLKYRVNNNYFVSLSATFRRTFTDYIDDVSTNYIDPNLFDKYLSAYSASIAKKLSFREAKSETSETGIQRGEKGKDSYTSVFFTISYLFDRRDINGFVVY